jgi:ribonuclease HII
MENRINKDIILECGIDEAGRGCLVGRVYTASVILPDTFPDEIYLQIKDSKKLSIKKRDILRKYIETHAISYSVDYADIDEITNDNILHATIKSMHRAISKLSVKPEYIAVDGNYWKPYIESNNELIPHMLVTGGDNKYRNIAAASILAKTHHDQYINELVDNNPELEKYGLRKNMSYGTKIHLDAIKTYGISQYHRKTFGICREYA